jgi:hypothetical protein
MALPTPAWSTSRIASIRSVKLIACGLTLCRREKVRSWLVSAAPRLVAVSIAVTARCSLAGPFLQHMHAAADDHQEVVEVMSDAAGELAERVELLGLGELPLHRLELELRVAPLGDIAGDLGKAHHLAILVDRIDHDARPEECAVLADAPAFLLVAALFARNPERTRRLAVGAVGLGVEAGEVLAEDFLRRIALDALAADVPARDDPAGVEHVEGVVGDPLHQQPETSFAFEQVPLLIKFFRHTRPHLEACKRATADFVPRI